MSDKDRPTLFLVDGFNLIFRAFYAIKHDMTAPDGTPVNAVFGVARMILALLKKENPKYLAVVLDAGGKTFRHEIYPEYKANRPPAPEELKVQFPLVKEAVEALALPLIVREGFEADDVIGTLATLAAENGYDVVIISGDKDLMQLVSERVVVRDTMKKVTYDASGVKTKLGVAPGQVIDLLALQGDSSDNIPGVSKVGPKTAGKLLAEHGDLDSVLAAAPGMKKSKLRDNLVAQAETARLSRHLATIDCAVPLDVTLDDLKRRDYDKPHLDAFLARLGFESLRRELTVSKSLDASGYRTILDRKDLEGLVAHARKAGECALDLETTSLDAMRAEIVGLSLCPEEGQAVYVPLAHSEAGGSGQLPAAEVIDLVGSLVADPAVKIYGQNIKYDAVVLANRHGLRLPRVACDSMLASYVLDPGRTSHGLDALSVDLLDHRPITYVEVAGKGAKQIPFADVPIAQATQYAAEDADLTLRLCRLLRPQVEREGLLDLLEDTELPLVDVLVDMELAGVRVDAEQLRRMSDELANKLAELVERIHLLAGREFNINSPAQLRVVLFDEMGFEVKKKTKSGPSTDSSVLMELAAGHELPATILDYRAMAKLKSTYVDVLPEMINPGTGRIHTSYNQAVTATGRLSSSNPNLQNIPIKTDMGLRIREAFVASDGNLLLSADYSQVELRILAHLSQDENLLAAFRDGEDIHARTAARIYGVPIEKVDSRMRSGAKAVNFGIIYGQGPYNLARQLRISRTEAKEIIDNYLDRYPGVRHWVADCHTRARAEKMVWTLFGRRRKLPEIDSSNHNVRANAERIAQNTPVQGTAADIIKRAMIDVHRAMAEHGLKARLVLQVHDELVFEVPKAELNLLEVLVREKMEGAAKLDVELAVDISTGANWAEAH
jgi:DNA polymerase I